ncbi:MAG: hypothetical protein ACTSVI_11370 [Promethearchaeota archaeon]
MQELIKLIKTIPNVNLQDFEKALQCSKFWETCIKLQKVSIKKLDSNKFHWDISISFILDPIGVTKIPVELHQDLLFEEDKTFSGDGKKWKYWCENSNAINVGEGDLYFKQSNNGIKMMVVITKIDIKAGFLDIVGIGKSMAISRLKQELQDMILNLIEIANSGKIVDLLKNSC